MKQERGLCEAMTGAQTWDREVILDARNWNNESSITRLTSFCACDGEKGTRTGECNAAS